MEEIIIPNKRYFVISEAAKLCGVKPHVLRYWGEEFSQLRPARRSGSRRYYQQKDIELIIQIKDLLYNKGFTIAGAKLQLKKNNEKSAKELIKEQIKEITPLNNEVTENIKEITIKTENSFKVHTEEPKTNSNKVAQVINMIRKDLEDLLEVIKA